MSSLSTETLVVDPKLAARFLETQGENRPLSRVTVAHYARLMREDMWELNGEAIKFDSIGRLIDGQHRLSAVVSSGKSVPMLVVKGLNGRSFETLDTGKVRSPADLVALEGYNHTSPLVGASRAIIEYNLGIFSGRPSGSLKVTPMEIIDTIKKNPDVVSAVNAVKGTYKEFGKLWSPSYAAFLLTIARRQSAIKADQFFFEVSTGEVANLDSVTWMLRQRLMQSVASRTNRLPRVVASGIAVKAWIAYRDDKEVKRLKFNGNEEFPKF